MECNNTLFKEQINPDTCVIYREGVVKEDIHKEPFVFRL